MKTADEVTLDDVGTKVIADVQVYPVAKEIVREVQMVIKAPRGRLIIYNTDEIDSQCEAIKYFIKEHRYD